jgi:hypothetical protein
MISTIMDMSKGYTLKAAGLLGTAADKSREKHASGLALS